MVRILVTTDLSEKSKAGLYFALQLSRQMPVELVFLHVSKLFYEPGWVDVEDENRMVAEREQVRKVLEGFVMNIAAEMGILPINYKCEVYYRFGVVNSIKDYAATHHCDYICMSTGGAGTISKYLGTNTSNLIAETDIPIFCIPQHYTPRQVQQFLYASDMKSCETELAKVAGMAKLLKAAVRMIHFSDEPLPANGLPKGWNNDPGYPVDVTVLPTKDRDFRKAMEQAITDFTPSVIVMFTDQYRSFFDLFFNRSKTSELSFSLNLPMLVYKKERKPA